jgi:hypothetical protein
VCIALVGVSCLAPMATADDEPFGDKPAAAKTDENPDRASEIKIRRALGSSTTLEFYDEPLSTVISFLSDSHGIPIALHASGKKQDEGIEETPVRLNVKGVSLRSALQLVLEPRQLTFVVRNGVLLITTLEAAERMIDIRVYEVADVLSDGKNVNELASLLREVASTQTEELALVPYGNLLAAKASLPAHDRIVDVLTKLREKLKPAKNN